MGRLEPVTDRASRSRTARPSSPRTAPLLTSRRHIDLLRVSSAVPLA
ncbi:putative leader peptide [Streptomyces sp. NPDC093260]